MAHQDRWVGRILRDKWRIDARIARGGMGTVFAATHRNNGSTAAIKILHPEFSRDEDTRSRFLQEGYAANKVSHPGVVRILDDDVTEEGLAYLVMELLQGELLEQRRIRKGGKLPLVEVYQFADQLLDVLAAAHAAAIVHRDIKPDNIFLTSQGRLKVLDFGFAQMKTTYRPEQTATGFLLGTPGFMAPEQAIGNRPMIDARTDIWAVGATLFLLLTGQPVHDGESPAEQLVAAANFPVRSITTLEAALPTKLAHAIDRALEFERDNRWPDARSMQEALRAIPGKQTPAAPIRSSFVDEHERRPYLAQPVPPDDATQQDLVDEVGADDLQLSGESAAYRGHAHPADADLERRTVARPPSPALLRAANAAPLYPAPDPDGKTIAQDTSTRRGHGFEAISSEETLVMDSRPVRPPTLGTPVPPPRPVALPLPPPPMPPQMQMQMQIPTRPEYPVMPVPIGFADTAPPQRSSRVVVFLILAGITAIVVILAGLVVLLALD